MNLILWLVHFALLAYSWPLIRFWWNGDLSEGYYSGVPKGRKRWAVVASFLLPTLAWLWLLPCSIGYRWKRDELEYVRHQAECRANRDRDIAFWREQAADGDLHSKWLALDLLALWGVPLVEPRRTAPAAVVEVRAATWDRYAARPRALPGAHEYSHGCDCRNCVRARTSAPAWLTGRPVAPPGWKTNPDEWENEIYL